MNSPYTAHFEDALMAAQSACAATLSAVVWSRPLRSKVGTAFLLVAVWIAALLPVELELLHSFDLWQQTPKLAMNVLKLSAALASVAVVLNGRAPLYPLAFLGELALSRICDFIEDSNYELAGLHLLWFGVLLGACRAAEQGEAPRPATDARASRSFWREDLVMAAIAVALALLVAFFVTERSIDSDDEWAYTWQADAFGHGHAYMTAPPCGDAFRMYWVFFYLGRAFSQYTPGWPLFMAPFTLLRAPWLAAPVTHGLLAIGVARLARRVTTANGGTLRQITYAGRIAVFAAVTGAAALQNAGSRFPHIFCAACFAFAVDAVCGIVAAGNDTKAKGRYGVLLGVSASALCSTRPADGTILLLGAALVFAYELLRGRIGWRAFAGAALSAALIGGLTLVILRLQLGEWFKTGYDIVSLFEPIGVVKFSVPLPAEFKYGIPLATMAYSFWPCAPALGAAGLVDVRGQGRAVAFMLVTGSLALAAFLVLLEFGRGRDFGYGPRYSLPHIVPMAVGTGALIGPMVADATRRFSARSALSLAGPATLAVSAMVAGALRIAPLMHPFVHDEIRLRNALFRAIRSNHVHNAVVTVGEGAIFSNPLDVTQNLPSQLRRGDVIIATPNRPGELECVQRNYPGRRFFRATGRGTDVTLTPY